MKSPGAMCLALCGTDGDCRDGYACAPRPDAAGHASAKVCVPAAGAGGGGMGGSMGAGGMGVGGMGMGGMGMGGMGMGGMDHGM